MKSTLLSVGATVVVMGAAGGVLAALGWLHLGDGFRPLQVPGDTPVLVSDGSLHAHSANGWMEKNDSQVLTAIPDSGNPASGSLQAGCGLPNSDVAILWTDDDTVTPIGAGATVTIKHDSADTAQKMPNVTIKLPSSKGPLTIKTDEGVFEAEKAPAKGGHHNRQHSRPGEVESISILDSAGATVYTWPPANYQSLTPHFTLAFCYK